MLKEGVIKSLTPKRAPWLLAFAHLAILLLAENITDLFVPSLAGCGLIDYVICSVR